MQTFDKDLSSVGVTSGRDLNKVIDRDVDDSRIEKWTT